GTTKGVEVKTMVTLSVAVLAFVAAGTAAADSTPVGPLPPPAVTKVTTAKGSLVAVSLPARPAGTGLVWRVARPLDARVVRQGGGADGGAAGGLGVPGGGRRGAVRGARVPGRRPWARPAPLRADPRRRLAESRSRGPLRRPRDLIGRSRV